MIKFGSDPEGKTIQQMVRETLPLAIAAGKRVSALFEKPVEMPFEKVYCIAAGTQVSLASGLAMPIEALAGCPDIMAYDKDLGGVRGTKCEAFMIQGTKSCTELLLSDGTLLVCTPDHQILNSTGSWVKAADLRVGVDEVSMAASFPETSAADMDISGTFAIELPSLGGRLTMSTHANQLLAFSRLYGLMLTDGYFGPLERVKSGATSEVYVGHKLDADRVTDDIFILTRQKPTIRQREGGTAIVLPQEITQAFLDTGTAATGKPSSHLQSRLPAFLQSRDCPRAIKREFLSGLFSGDGGAPHPTYLPNGNVQFAAVTLVQTRQGDHVCEEKERFAQIQELLAEFEVKSRGVDVRAALRTQPEVDEANLSKSGDDLDPSLKYVMTMHLRSEATYYFHKWIGFRYCVHKQQRLSAIAGYYRLARRIATQKRSVFDEGKRLRMSGHSIPSALRHALEVVARANTLHPHVLKWKADTFGEMLGGRSKAPGDGEDCYPPMSCREYLESSGISRYFSDPRGPGHSHHDLSSPTESQATGSVNYGVQHGDQHLGMWRAKVLAVRDVGEKPVYDLSAGALESFVASSVVVHNCPYLLCNQKRYAGLYWTNGDAPDKLDAKGLQTVRRDSCELASDAQKQTLAILFDLNERNPIQRAVQFVQRITGELVRGEAEFHKLIITKALSKELDDAELKTNAAHVWLALRKAKMDSGAKAHATDRVLYMMILQQKKRGKVNGKAADVKAFMCAEDPMTVLKLNLELHYQWYVTNQLQKPIEHVLEHVIGKEGCKKLWQGDHMRKIHRPTPVADERNKNGILGMGNITRFICVQQACSSASCKAPLRSSDEKKRGLCVSCQPDREQVRAKGMEAYRKAAAERAALLEVCRKCQKGSMLLVNACTTITCGTFSKRKKKHDEMLKAHRNLVAIANDW
jgi:hypothetical protein